MHYNHMFNICMSSHIYDSVGKSENLRNSRLPVVVVTARPWKF
jgi:hypothetical protein